MTIGLEFSVRPKEYLETVLDCLVSENDERFVVLDATAIVVVFGPGSIVRALASSLARRSRRSTVRSSARSGSWTTISLHPRKAQE